MVTENKYAVASLKPHTLFPAGDRRPHIRAREDRSLGSGGLRSGVTGGRGDHSPHERARAVLLLARTTDGLLLRSWKLLLHTYSLLSADKALPSEPNVGACCFLDIHHLTTF